MEDTEDALETLRAMLEMLGARVLIARVLQAIERQETLYWRHVCEEAGIGQLTQSLVP